MDDNFTQGYMVGRDGSNNNGGWGADGAWFMWIILLVFLFRGWGGNGGSDNQQMGYELGKLATQQDIASGFNNSAVISKLNDITLAQNTGFAGVQQTLCQGFGGINTALVQSGFETRGAISDLGYRMQDCCCQTQRAIDGVNYNMAKNTCDITNAINASTRDIIDSQRCGTQEILGFLTQEKISSLQAENAALTAQLSQNAQTRTLIDTLRPIPVPAYPSYSPFQSLYGFNNGCGCGCGF